MDYTSHNIMRLFSDTGWRFVIDLIYGYKCQSEIVNSIPSPFSVYVFYLNNYINMGKICQDIATWAIFNILKFMPLGNT